MLTPATDYLYIKPSLIALSQNIFEETKDDSWEIDSDQLNTSFDSDSELTSKDQNVISHPSLMIQNAGPKWFNHLNGDYYQLKINSKDNLKQLHT